MIFCPLLPAFFSKFPLILILWNIVLALSFCHFSFLFPCPFFLFFLFLSARALLLWYFFPLRPYLIQYTDPWDLFYTGGKGSGSLDNMLSGSFKLTKETCALYCSVRYGTVLSSLPVLWIRIGMDPHLFDFPASGHWVCGSGSKSIAIDQNIQISLDFWLSTRLFFHRRYVFDL